MTLSIEIVERKQVKTLEVYESIPMWKMPKVIGNTYQSITDYLESINTEPLDAPYIKYINLNWQALDTESKFAGFIKAFTRKWEMFIGFSVPEGTAAAGNLKSGEFSGGSYVQALHKGPYHKVGDTYKHMRHWISQKDICVKNESVEIYLNDPRTTKKADLETLVLIPLTEQPSK